MLLSFTLNCNYYGLSIRFLLVLVSLLAAHAASGDGSIVKSHRSSHKSDSLFLPSLQLESDHPESFLADGGLLNDVLFEYKDPRSESSSRNNKNNNEINKDKGNKRYRKLVNYHDDYNEDEYEETKCSNDICQKGLFKWHASKTKNLYVGGIFPMVGGWPGGQSCLPSAIMALNEVNLNASILPDYRLNMNWFNSECNPGKGVSNLYQMIFHQDSGQDDIIMLLGPGCSDVSSSVAEVANYYNLTVVRAFN
jgi:hypothetical protein